MMLAYAIHPSKPRVGPKTMPALHDAYKPTDARSRPSGENLTAATDRVCPVKLSVALNEQVASVVCMGAAILCSPASLNYRIQASRRRGSAVPGGESTLARASLANASTAVGAARRIRLPRLPACHSAGSLQRAAARGAPSLNFARLAARRARRYFCACPRATRSPLQSPRPARRLCPAVFCPPCSARHEQPRAAQRGQLARPLRGVRARAHALTVQPVRCRVPRHCGRARCRGDKEEESRRRVRQRAGASASQRQRAPSSWLARRVFCSRLHAFLPPYRLTTVCWCVRLRRSKSRRTFSWARASMCRVRC